MIGFVWRLLEAAGLSLAVLYCGDYALNGRLTFPHPKIKRVDWRRLMRLVEKIKRSKD
jgi:hypothetical protein